MERQTGGNNKTITYTLINKKPTNEEKSSSDASNLQMKRNTKEFLTNEEWINNRRAPIKHIDSDEFEYQLDSPTITSLADDDNDINNQDEEYNKQRFNDENYSSLEEVYLCTCCGTTRELTPAMKYLPLFSNLFYLFNFLVLVSGVVNLALGLWFRFDPKVYELHKYIETQNFTIAGWILLFGGLSALLLAFVGFSGASKHSTCVLVFYSIFMTLLTIVFIGALVLLTVFGLGDSLERFLNKEIYEQIRRRSMASELSFSDDSAQFLDFVQVKLRCCGAQEFRDYAKLGMVVPTTCYTIANNFISAPGCGQALRELFDLRAGLATGFAAGSVVAQLVSVLLASLMACSIYNYRAEPRPASAMSYVATPDRLSPGSSALSTTHSTRRPPSGRQRPLSRNSSIEV